MPHLAICDFGQLFGEEMGSEQMGTAAYMAPDVALEKGFEAADDVLSYGILLHEIFIACVPYKGRRAMEIMYEVAENGLRPSCGEDREIPQDMRLLIENCWEAEREKRPSFKAIIKRLMVMGVTEDGDNYKCRKFRERSYEGRANAD